jgi:hypothetical protein
MYITSFPNYRKIKRHADRPGSLVSSFLLISEWSRSSLVFFFLGGATAVQRRRAFLLCMVPCARIWRVTARQRIALFFLVFIWAWLQQPCDNSIFFVCADIFSMQLPIAQDSSHALLNFLFFFFI